MGREEPHRLHHYSDLAAKPAVIDLIRREVEKVNAGLTDVQRVAKFVLLYKELDADDGELTAPARSAAASSTRSTAT